MAWAPPAFMIFDTPAILAAHRMAGFTLPSFPGGVLMTISFTPAILGGTAFMSDLGMTGPWYSSIGRVFKPVLQKFLTGVPSRFDVADGPATLEGAVITFDAASRKATAIEPFRYREPLPPSA